MEYSVMQEIRLSGKFADAIIYTVDDSSIAIDQYALAQIQQLCDFEASEGNVIRVMPDVHPGKACVIGLTMTLTTDKVMPNLVGVDIGCGVYVAKLGRFSHDFAKLDKVIATSVPSGFSIHSKEVEYGALDDLCCAKHVQLDMARRSLGTLGGGNHFCEIARGCDEEHFLIIHTGSRHLGKEVCEWYLKNGRKQNVPYELTWLAGNLREEYLQDIKIVQAFASTNRAHIAKAITKGMKWTIEDAWESIHNYIDFSQTKPVLRKGAISALNGERVIIPVNMRDGSIVGIGKGNAAWNWSAPHGSGRISSRAKTKELFTLPAFKESMQGIYSSCVCKDTLDEAPFAYRAQADIVGALHDTVDVSDILRPVYNFKAGSKK